MHPSPAEGSIPVTVSKFQTMTIARHMNLTAVEENGEKQTANLKSKQDGLTWEGKLNQPSLSPKYTRKR